MTLQFNTSDLSLIVEGVLFLAVILLLPRGVIPTAGDWVRRLRPSSASPGEQPGKERRQVPPGAAPDSGGSGGSSPRTSRASRAGTS
jgi:hypothetical protein